MFRANALFAGKTIDVQLDSLLKLDVQILYAVPLI